MYFAFTIFRSLQPHVAHVVVLRVDTGRPARRTGKTGGVAAETSSFNGIVQHAKLTGIFGQRQTEHRTVFFLISSILAAMRRTPSHEMTPVAATANVLRHAGIFITTGL